MGSGATMPAGALTAMTTYGPQIYTSLSSSFANWLPWILLAIVIVVVLGFIRGLVNHAKHINKR